MHPCQVQVGEVPPETWCRLKDSDRPQAPTKDHWNIALDLILPWNLADSQSHCEAQQAAQAEEEGSKEAGMSQPEVPAHGEPPGIQVGSGNKLLPTRRSQ